MVSERISVHEPTFEEMVTDFPDSVKGLLQTARQKLLQIHYVDGFRSPYQEWVTRDEESDVFQIYNRRSPARKVLGLIVYHQPQVGSGAKFNFHFFDRQKHSYSASFDGEGRCVQIADCQQHRHLVVGRNASGRLTITVSFPVVLTFEAEIDEITLSPREPEEALQQFIDSL